MSSTLDWISVLTVSTASVSASCSTKRPAPEVIVALHPADARCLAGFIGMPGGVPAVEVVTPQDRLAHSAGVFQGGARREVTMRPY
ncbi:hypothetical protein OG203_34080 [Nocardia sp. NBC_01499]|uniref:hypothetical protein n=1 Tax=Nocardia sp. NBC_01499 TaxID=2903597 RepID=UPI0038675EA7